MKRKIIVLIFVSVFNFVLIEGINYTNQYMFKHNFLIRLNEDKEEKPSEVIPGDDTPIINTDYNGESASSIGKKIEKLLKKSDLEGYGEYIATTSIKKGVNPYLIGGIILENTNCAAECSIIVKNCNNVGELKGSPGCFGGSYKKYNLIEESIDDLVNYIYDNFVSNDLTNPNAIYKKYGKDTTWAFKVNRYMEKIKKSK